MRRSLYHKVFEAHTVRKLASGKVQLFIGLHLIHEVTSPQAFAALKERGLKVRHPELSFATVDHIIPTDASRRRPLMDSMAEEMFVHLERNCREHGIAFFGEGSDYQGIVHVIGPELGLTQPGMTVACGDSHTSTHGAFGALAFGIGTSQVRDVLATQTLSMEPLKVRRIEVGGKLKPGVYAKDIILQVIRELGVQGGVGYAYEYAGTAIESLGMEERMTICNMAIEGGARAGYVNPDQKTYEYIKGRPHAPSGENWSKAVAYWDSMRSDRDADYDDVRHFRAADIEPQVTWGITPAQSVGVNESIPSLASFAEGERALVDEACRFMGVEPGQKMKGLPVDVCFIGSCTNSRMSDLEEVARLVRGHRVAQTVKALVVPGSQEVRREAEKRGLHEVFRAAGFEWREPGCSMCLAMNPDRLQPGQRCASSSNRNFKGRQGSSTGRTLLMSPAMVAAAAVAGCVADAREVFSASSR